MPFNSVTNIETCFEAIKVVPGILYYSHIPTTISAVFVGLFIFLKNKNILASKILFTLTILFFLWAICDLVTWTTTDSRWIMITWALLSLLFALFSLLSLYLVYVFVNNRDISLKSKILFTLLILPIIIFTPTEFNLVAFDIPNCESVEGDYFTNYSYLLSIFFSLWIVIFLVAKYLRAEKRERKQIFLFGSGITLCLIAFVGSNIIGSLTLNWKIVQYGIFGMPIFMAFLAYLIVKYQIFNIKLAGAQALVVSLIILTGAQFSFIQNPVNKVLTAITLLLAAIFGWWLVRSVKDEIKKKEELLELTEKLSEAYRRMKQLDRAKSEFVSIASHQLRTPLTAIKGFISLLLDGTYGSIPQSSRGVLEKVYLSNERLISLVEDLLNISRIESGRMVFSFKSNDISHLVGDIVENMVFAAKNKNLYLDFKAPQPSIAEFVFDKDKLREVISNMVDNAIKYTKKGGVTVRIREVKNAMGEFVQVIVADTGVGIAKGEEQYIFEKFQRGKDISRVHTEGIGLGLYVANKIIEAHQGKMWAESDGLGRGSRFYLQLKKDFVAPINAQMQENGKVAVEFSTQDDGKKEPAKTEA